jgi:FKBP-type peptidyl-prolyl cis-trans isomerase FkpA
MNPNQRRRGVLIALLGVFAAASVACDFGSSSPTAPDQTNVQYSQTDLTVGTGTVAATGNTVTTSYGAWLYSETATDHKGQQFDAGTISFVLGSGQIIKGFDMGVTGMAVGGTRRIICPPSLGFGANGNPTANIPPNAALVFDIQLTNVQ